MKSRREWLGQFHGRIPEEIKGFWVVLKQTNSLFEAIKEYPDAARQLYGEHGQKAARSLRKDVQYVLETGQLPEGHGELLRLGKPQGVSAAPGKHTTAVPDGRKITADDGIPF